MEASPGAADDFQRSSHRGHDPTDRHREILLTNG
jgi:hypothetical protein